LMPPEKRFTMTSAVSLPLRACSSMDRALASGARG
jgi:hypothetical protein